MVHLVLHPVVINRKSMMCADVCNENSQFGGSFMLLEYVYNNYILGVSCMITYNNADALTMHSIGHHAALMTCMHGFQGI